MNLQTMTVGELKAYLDEFPDNAKVVFSYPSPDNYEACGTINSAEYGTVEFNKSYNEFIFADEYNGENAKGIVVLVLG